MTASNVTSLGGGTRPRLAAPVPLQASIAVNADQVDGHVSPMLYGQFVEFMRDGVNRGMTAELLRDRSFEDTPDPDGLPAGWGREPDARVDDPAVSFHQDAANPYPTTVPSGEPSPAHSLAMEVRYDDGLPHGVNQAGVPVRAGVPYNGYLWIKSADFQGTIKVGLQADAVEGEPYASATLTDITGDWKKYTFTLTPSKTDPLARLTIVPQGQGRLWIDQASLMPGDAVGGIRQDVFDKTKALHPSLVRYPGGNVAQNMHWQWGIGPRDSRPTWINGAWGNVPESSDFGTDEYVQYCRNIGAQPAMTVNVEGDGATADEAAAWVEYCNGAATSKYGAMRAANGHPEPYNVKYWEVGNEIWGPWNLGHSDAQTYASNLNRYVKAMKAVDPSITIVACGDNNPDWNRTVLSQAGQNIDYLAIHHYYGSGEIAGDNHNLLARPLGYENFYQDVDHMAKSLVPGHRIQLDINEWNSALPGRDEDSMLAGLYAGRMMNVFERQGDTVGLEAVSDMVNGWSGGMIQAARNQVFVSPTYLVNELYAEHVGTDRLHTTVESPTFDSTREGNNNPYLDVVVTRSADGRQIFVKAVNTHPDQAMSTTLNLSGVKVKPGGTLETVNGPHLMDANGFAHPDTVHIDKTAVTISDNTLVDLPAHSVSVLTLDVA